jgi:protein-arginine kinase activator protein McsA
MKKCVQCQEPADLHIKWLAKKTETENEPQECDICSSCLSLIWNGGGTDANGKKLHGFKHTQFGQTLTIMGVNE